jgi:hypothetical protein
VEVPARRAGRLVARRSWISGTLSPCWSQRVAA